MKEKIIEIKNLSKNFGDIKAVQNLSFSVEKGELFAFLGEYDNFDHVRTAFEGCGHGRDKRRGS